MTFTFKIISIGFYYKINILSKNKIIMIKNGVSFNQFGENLFETVNFWRSFLNFWRSSRFWEILSFKKYKFKKNHLNWRTFLIHFDENYGWRCKIQMVPQKKPNCTSIWNRPPDFLQVKKIWIVNKRLYFRFSSKKLK